MPYEYIDRWFMSNIMSSNIAIGDYVIEMQFHGQYHDGYLE